MDDTRKYIDAFLPDIDQALSKNNIPIDKRSLQAGYLFVDCTIEETSYNTKDEFLKSRAFREVILFHINEWYIDKYGDLSSSKIKNFYSGIVLVYNQPTLIRIPAKTSEVLEKGQFAKLTFPDHLQESENIKGMFELDFNLDRMGNKKLRKLKDDIEKVVSLSRSINLNLITVSGLQNSYSQMAKSIWSHVEDAISNIISEKTELSSKACWDLHLAIEKSIKVLTNSETGKQPCNTHNLNTLLKEIDNSKLGINLSSIKHLPTDKDANKLRYVEITKTPLQAYKYYKIALILLSDITSKLDRDYEINNMSIKVKKVPWI